MAGRKSIIIIVRDFIILIIMISRIIMIIMTRMTIIILMIRMILKIKIIFDISSAVEEKPSSAGSKSSKKEKEAENLVEVKSSGYSKKYKNKH